MRYISILTYAWVFVENKADKELAHKIKLQIEEGEEMEIDIVYERVPPICKQFQSFGHVRAPLFN